MPALARASSPDIEFSAVSGGFGATDDEDDDDVAEVNWVRTNAVAVSLVMPIVAVDVKPIVNLSSNVAAYPESNLDRSDSIQ